MHLNGQRLPIKSFQEYVDQYLGPKENGVPRIYERFSDRWEVCISTTEGQFQQVRCGGTGCGCCRAGTQQSAPPRGSSSRRVWGAGSCRSCAWRLCGGKSSWLNLLL